MILGGPTVRDGRICLYSTKVQFVLGDRHATGMIIRCGHWHAELEGYYQSLRHCCHGARFWGRENQWRNKSPVDTQRPQPPTVTVYLQARIRSLNTLKLHSRSPLLTVYELKRTAFKLQ